MEEEEDHEETEAEPVDTFKFDALRYLKPSPSTLGFDRDAAMTRVRISY